MTRLFVSGVVPELLRLHGVRSTRIAVAAIAALVLPLEGQAQGKDDLWEVTTKMEMAGMPMAMPAQTSRMCTAKNRKDEDLIPRRENCKLLESNRSGNKITYKMACTGKERTISPRFCNPCVGSTIWKALRMRPVIGSPSEHPPNASAPSGFRLPTHRSPTATESERWP